MYPDKCRLLLLLTIVAAAWPITQAAGVTQLVQPGTAAARQAFPPNCTAPRTFADTLKPYCVVPNYLSPGAQQFLATTAAGLIPWNNLNLNNRTELAEVREFFRVTSTPASEAAKAVFLQSVRNGTVAGVPVVYGVPKGADSNTQPCDTKVALYFHGGGYILGSCQWQWSTVAPTAARAGLTTICVEYRLAPEHPFPAGLNDVLAVYKGLLREGYQAKNIVLLGDSAGGGLVAAATIQLQREGFPLPAALGMFSPYADPDPSIPFDTKSTLIAIDPIFSPVRPGFPTLGSQYVGGNTAEFENPLVSPRRADWAGLFPYGELPPTLIQVGLREILLSQGVLLYHAMKAAAPYPGSVSISPYDGMWHVFQASFALPEAESAHKEMADFFSRALSSRLCSA